MAAIYKLGTQWVVFGDAKFTLDAGSCIAVETADGTSLTLKLKPTMESILSVKYTSITNEAGAAYTKDQVLALLSEFIPTSIQPNYVDSVITITRPANTTPYSDGDAILDVVGIATQKFAGVAKLTGRGVNFINLLAYTNDTGLAGKTINVVFYKQSPASPIADNAAFSYASANELIRKGTVSLTFGTGILAGVAQLGIDVTAGMLNLEICPTATDVFVQVWLPTGYTPSANSTYIILKASAIQN